MSRKHFGGARLQRDVAQLLVADKESPPQARPSLMDAVRAFTDFIEARATLGWTDGMIAAVLTEAGYPIAAATLRSYRKRLRDEGLMPPLPAPRPTKVMSDAGAAAAAQRVEDMDHQESATPTPVEQPFHEIPPPVTPVPPSSPPPPATASTVSARAPPDAPPPRRTFTVNRTNRPEDRA